MAAIDRPAVRLGCAAAALALFCAAYAFPAIGTCSRDPARMINWFDNSTVLFFGWLGIFNLQFGWFANIALGARSASTPHSWRSAWRACSRRWG